MSQTFPRWRVWLQDKHRVRRRRGATRPRRVPYQRSINAVWIVSLSCRSRNWGSRSFGTKNVDPLEVFVATSLPHKSTGPHEMIERGAVHTRDFGNRSLRHLKPQQGLNRLLFSVQLRFPAYSTDFCHPVHGNVATQSMGMLPSSPRHDCHPRSVATLDRMISLGSLLLSMVVALAVRFFAGLPPEQQQRSQPMRRAPRQLDNAASRWSLGATRCWACQIYTDAALANVACRLRMESPFKAIL